MDLSNENVIHIRRGEIEYLQFRKLNQYPEISHAYILKPLDLRSHNSNDVVQNYKVAFDSLDLKIETLLRPHQKHTDNVVCIHEKKNEDKPDIFMDYLENIDGAITDKSGITLATTNADCILLLIYDPVKKVIANVHSGWRGTFAKICEVAVKKMIAEYDSKPEDIVVCICPSIRKCHFEVDMDVKEECEKIFSYTNKLDEIIRVGEVKEGKQKYFIDTVMINKIVLQDLGVKEENIIDSGICSVCCHEKIHSRRADGIDYGLGSAIIFGNWDGSFFQIQ
ncbi:MAG: peptidoglycan editing factor PgeF [Clostridia bacterium]|nr:peptidoglycan editing factor PgeF [Clostridia bacterium]